MKQKSISHPETVRVFYFFGHVIPRLYCNQNAAEPISEQDEVLVVPPEEEELLSAGAKPAPIPVEEQLSASASVSKPRRSEDDLVERLQQLLAEQQLHYDLQILQLQQQMAQMQLQHQHELQQLQVVGGGEHAPRAQGESS
jgi:hypothetical protein